MAWTCQHRLRVSPGVLTQSPASRQPISAAQRPPPSSFPLNPPARAARLLPPRVVFSFPPPPPSLHPCFIAEVLLLLCLLRLLAYAPGDWSAGNCAVSAAWSALLFSSRLFLFSSRLFSSPLFSSSSLLFSSLLFSALLFSSRLVSSRLVSSRLFSPLLSSSLLLLLDADASQPMSQSQSTAPDVPTTWPRS